MVYLHLFVAGMIFTLRQLFTWAEDMKSKYIFTPLCTLSIITLCLYNLNTYSIIMGIALLFCLVGDIFLMLDDEDYFETGVKVFSIAQILFIILFCIYGYTQDGLFLVFGVVLGLVYFVICKKTNIHNEEPLLFVYGFLLFVMVFFSWFMPTFVFIGGILFLISDLVILVDKMKGIKHATVLTWAFYAPALLCFALSCLQMD